MPTTTGFQQVVGQHWINTRCGGEGNVVFQVAENPQRAFDVVRNKSRSIVGCKHVGQLLDDFAAEWFRIEWNVVRVLVVKHDGQSGDIGRVLAAVTGFRMEAYGIDRRHLCD